MSFLQQNEEELAFVFPDDIELPGSDLDESKILRTYLDRITPAVADPSVHKAILCLFSWGYYGSNKTAKGGKGIMIKINGEKLDLSETLNISKEAKGSNNPEVLTASKLARIGVGYAYKQSENPRHKASPVWKKCPPWKREKDKRFLQIHGHLIPLRIPDMGPDEKVACIAINAVMQFSSSRGEYRESAMKRISTVCRLTSVAEGAVSEYIKTNINTGTIGGPAGEISIFMNTLLPKNVTETATSDSGPRNLLIAKLNEEKKKLEDELAKLGKAQ
jgi:hypothetical protein